MNEASGADGHMTEPSTAGTIDEIVKVVKGRYAGHYARHTTYESPIDTAEYLRLTSGELVLLALDAYRKPVEGEFGYKS